MLYVHLIVWARMEVQRPQENILIFKDEHTNTYLIHKGTVFCIAVVTTTVPFGQLCFICEICTDHLW